MPLHYGQQQGCLCIFNWNGRIGLECYILSAYFENCVVVLFRMELSSR
jgi:hypothetical protein